ncbi:autotransporter beta-domain-containing protein [Campylobacter jejuni subsp. doylei]|nr:autotransporter beta-domain-containing protein [Campylobacter jejuni subsp. doylei]
MKNTSLVKTLGGGVKEYSFNSKKIVLSLATISFLASYANATDTSNACPTTSARSGSGSNKNYTISSGSNCSGITLTNSQTSTLTITNEGTIEASDYTTSSSFAIGLTPSGNTSPTLENFNNQGTIKGKIKIENSNGFTGTITVGTFENKSGGTIDGDIYMGLWNGSGTISIENFNNAGTISGKSRNEKGVHFEAQNGAKVHIQTFKNSGSIESKDRQGVWFQGNVHVETFHNTGTISGGGKYSLDLNNNNNADSRKGGGGVVMTQGTIDTFKNSGTIESKDTQGVYFQGKGNAKVHVKTFENTNTGFISGSADGNFDREGQGFFSGGGVVMTQGTIDIFKNSGTIQSTGTTIKHNPAGVKLIQATVKTFENTNTGLISGLIGILVTGGTIETFKNSGTIESTSQGGRGAAIKIQTENNNPFSIAHFTNEGTIKSASDGVLIESGNKIETLINKGTIESKSNGISFYDNGPGSSPDKTHLGKIILEKGSSIKAEKNGINIDHETARSIRVGGIEVQKGASVSGDEAGIVNERIIGDDDKKGGIIISGEVSGRIAGILNKGKGSIAGSIVVENGGKLDSIINDEGATIGRGITHNGEGDLVILSRGLVGKDDKGNTVTNNSGSVTIKDWVVSTNEEGKLRTVVIGGTKTDDVKVNSITVDQSNVDLNELNDIKNIISGVSTNNIADSVKTNGGGEISLSFDPLSGRLSTDVQLNASIAGASFRSSLATASRRATFIDNVMANAMQSFSLGSDKAQKIALSEKGNLYADASDYIKNDSIMNDYIKSDLTQANYGLNKEHALFILPYLSSQSVELSLNEESKGHTKGTIIGYSTLKDSGIYGVYAGYEDKKMDSTYFDVNNISYYTGLKYFNTLFTTAKGQEVYIKAQVQAALIKNDFTKRIGKNEAKAKAHSYTYGINTALGMNFIADKNIFSPEAGFAYEGSYTEAFSMQDTRGQATVKGGERTYANHLNLFSTKTSFTWFRDWLPYLKTSVELGAKFNVNPKVKARARFGNMKVNDEFHLPRVRKFASTSLIVPVNEAFYFSLNYNGMFDEKGNTHTGFAQFNYLW